VGVAIAELQEGFRALPHIEFLKIRGIQKENSIIKENLIFFQFIMYRSSM
jgi:hypothetical protein